MQPYEQRNATQQDAAFYSNAAGQVGRYPTPTATEAPEPARTFQMQLQSLEKSLDVLYNVAAEVARRSRPLMPGGSVGALDAVTGNGPRTPPTPKPICSPTTEHVATLTMRVESVIAILSDINANIEV